MIRIALLFGFILLSSSTHAAPTKCNLALAQDVAYLRPDLDFDGEDVRRLPGNMRYPAMQALAEADTLATQLVRMTSFKGPDTEWRAQRREAKLVEYSAKLREIQKMFESAEPRPVYGLKDKELSDTHKEHALVYDNYLNDLKMDLRKNKGIHTGLGAKNAALKSDDAKAANIALFMDPVKEKLSFLKPGDRIVIYRQSGGQPYYGTFVGFNDAEKAINFNMLGSTYDYPVTSMVLEDTANASRLMQKVVGPNDTTAPSYKPGQKVPPVPAKADSDTTKSDTTEADTDTDTTTPE